MKKIKQILSLIIVGAMFIASGIGVSAKDVDELVAKEDYVYPITADSDNWFAYSVLEKNEMLRIDDSKLSQMSDEQLVQAVADYPYLIDLYAYDSMKDGIKNLVENCDAFKEILSRKNGVNIFKSNSNKLINEMSKSPSKYEDIDFKIIALNDINTYFNNLSKSEICEKDSSYPFSILKAPKGDYLMPSETHTTAYHDSLDSNVVKTYGVTLLRRGSCKYNCHSYAWYSQSSSNSYWLNSPSVYMNDGSYTKKYSGNISSSINGKGIRVNDVIYYAGNTHSALFIDNPASGAPIATMYAKSKWGKLGVFKHTVTNVPSGYNYSTVSIWHKN